MKQFKKKAFLFLAAICMTIVAVFAYDYKNSIMAVDFNPSGNHSVNMVLHTKVAYNGNMTPSKTDASTYVLMLPEVNNLSSGADFSNVGDISSVKITTRAYSGNAKGYTKITIKTLTPITIVGKNTIYQDSAEDEVSENKVEEREENRDYNRYEQVKRPSRRAEYTQRNTRRAVRAPETREIVHQPQNAEETEPDESFPQEAIGANVTQEETLPAENNSDEKLIIILGVLAIIAASIFFYLRAKDRLAQIAGERMDLDLEDEPKTSQKQKKRGEIKDTIKTLDKAYTKPLRMPVVSEYTQPAPVMNTEKSTDDMNIVDLDELFKEQVKNKAEQGEGNDALEDFLSDFEFEEIPEEKPEEEQFDEEAYNRIIANKGLRFSSGDLERIEQILSVEINDDTLRNIDKFAVSNPIKSAKRVSLEDMAASYTISQNIIFTKDDLKTLDKLMNVEIDADFVTDLKTNPERVAEMERQILEFQNSELKKPGEILTLKVADLLPNLEDVAAHPDKYNESEPEEVVIDADALLKNIENVTFKPFDDGTRQFEILNNFEEEKEEDVIEVYSSDYKNNAQENKSGEVVSQSEDTKRNNNTSEIRERGIIQKNVSAKTESAATSLKKANSALSEHSRHNARTNVNTNESRRIVDTKAPSKEIHSTVKCIMNGKTYSVLSSAAFNEYGGCHLAKSEDNYVVLSYYKNKLAILKEYDDLKSGKIQARLSEKLENGTFRYIVRIGTVKFIADYSDGIISYVMDL